jgi:hypothetical protein
MYLKKLIKIVIFYSAVFLFSRCENRYQKIYSEIVIPSPKRCKQDTIIKDSLHNFYFSRLNKASTSGMQFVFNVPEKNQDKELCVVFSGRARTNYAYSNASISFMALTKEGEQLFWNAIKLRNVFIGNNNWSAFRDSVIFPRNFFGKKYSLITGFPFLGESSSENFDVDSMRVEIREIIE